MSIKPGLIEDDAGVSKGDTTEEIPGVDKEKTKDTGEMKENDNEEKEKIDDGGVNKEEKIEESKKKNEVGKEPQMRAMMPSRRSMILVMPSPV